MSSSQVVEEGLFSTIEPIIADVPVSSAHSNESSSSEDILIPTPSQPSTTSKEIGQSGYSLPVRSSIQFSSLVDVQQSVPDSDPVGDSTDNMGENIDDPVDENPDTNADDHVEPTDNYAPNDVVPNVNVPLNNLQLNEDQKERNLTCFQCLCCFRNFSLSNMQ